MFDNERKFIPPWEKYKHVAKLVAEGDIGKAFEREELGWLQNDIDSWVNQALETPQAFDNEVVRALDSIGGIVPDDSSREGRIFQRWSSYPQVKTMLESTGLGRKEMLGYITSRVEAHKSKK